MLERETKVSGSRPARRCPGRAHSNPAPRRRPPAIPAVLAVLGLGLALAGPARAVVVSGVDASRGPGPAADPATATQATYDILLVGNSITDGDPVPPGFRQSLHDALNAGSNTFNFTGSSGTAPLHGHFQGGAEVEDFFPPSFGGNGSFDVGPDMGAPGNAPDAVVIHLGTNDINSQPGPYAPYSFNHGLTLQSTCAGEMGELHKYLEQWSDGTNSFNLDAVVLSLILPIQNRTPDVEAYNEALIDLSEDFAEGTATGSPIKMTLADHYSRFMTNPDLFSGGGGDWMSDPLHPNAAGYIEMAGVYRDAIEQTLTDGTQPSAVTDLAATPTGTDRITVTFSATGDDASSGRAARYDLRYATHSINASNFGLATQVAGEPAPGNAGSGESIEVTGLLEGTIYYLALKVVDDGGNRSSISNVDVATTGGAGGDIVDDFNRPGPDLGANWSADIEYQIQSGELANTSTDPSRIDYIATFVGLSNPLGAGFTWATSSDPAGRNQAGLALRLDAPSPGASGYLLYRDDPLNGFPNQWNLVTVVNGDHGGVLAAQVTSNLPAAPGDGDVIRVLLSSDSGGHHFDILVNGAFDVRLTDPSKLSGNSAVWYAGYMSNGAMNNNIDDFTLVTDPGQNVPPGAFDLASPADGTTLSTTFPFFDWTDAFDPDPGDVVSYTLYVSQNPSFPNQETTRISGLTSSEYTWTDFLARNTTYHWKVKAEDLQAASTWSNQTWSFQVPNLLSVVDDFERASLGPDWAAGTNWAIASGELADTDPTEEFTMAVYTPRSNPTAAAYSMGSGADSTGFDASAGLALMLDGPSATAGGYMIYRNWSPFSNWQIATLSGGQPSGVLPPPGRADATQLPPAAGDEVRVVMSSDAGGHHFDIYVRGQFDARVTDPNKLLGNGPTLYAGYVAAGNRNNNIDDFTLTGVDFNSPPAAFDLSGPPDGTLVVSLAPLLEWSEAVDPNPDDQVNYRVWYDTDPAFPAPDSLPATTALATPFTGPLLFGESYYWRVRAYDLAGASVWSNQTWSFSMADTLSVSDDFNRPGPDLGTQWVADASMQIAQIGGDGELANTSTSSGLDLAIFTTATNPDAVHFFWGQNVNATGIQRGGLALMMSAASPQADGYFVSIDPISNNAKLETISNGAPGLSLDSEPGLTGSPGAGAEFRVSLSTDGGGHHFDVFVNGNFHARLTDSQMHEGNGTLLYAGVALRGNQQNNVDDFTMSAFNFGPPPAGFALLEPAHGAIDVVQTPLLRWQAAGGPGLIYVVYLGTDSTFAPGTIDSVNVQGDTTLVWPAPLEIDTDYTWRVRATDGQQSSLSTPGWSRFRTTATAVELARFEALGEVERIVLRWQTTRERDHRGFHLWRRSAAAQRDDAFQRITGALLQATEGEAGRYEYVDEAVVAGQEYLYRLEAVDRLGGSQLFGPLRATALVQPYALRLAQNAPNPFNPSTTIAFELAATGSVRLSIYDVDGRTVRRLVDGGRPAGPHAARWDGRDDGGRTVASGIYFVRLETAGGTLTRKMMLVR